MHEKINHLMYMDNKIFFPDNEKELKSQIQTIRIFSEDFGMEKFAMLIMNQGKSETTKGRELPNLEITEYKSRYDCER